MTKLTRATRLQCKHTQTDQQQTASQALRTSRLNTDESGITSGAIVLRDASSAPDTRAISVALSAAERPPSVAAGDAAPAAASS